MIVNKGYKTLENYNCLIGCLENYLQYYNIPITGVDIFFLGRGFEINYKKNNYNNFFLKASNDYMSMLVNYGLQYKRIKMKECDELLKKHLIDLIEAEKALILLADSKKINYDSIFLRNEPVVHFFNLVGYSYEKDQFCISDSFIPAFKPFSKQVWIDSIDFFTMWESRKELFVIDLKNLKWNFAFSIKQDVVIQLKKYLEGEEREGVFYGKAAIRKLLFDVVSEVREKEAFDLIIKMNYQLRVNGFIMGREYLYTFLKKIEKHYYAERVLCLLEQWKVICLSFAKCVITKKSDKLEHTYNEAYKLCDKEEKLFEEILQNI